MPYRRIIAAAYDAGTEDEYNRLSENGLQRAEYHIIIEWIDKYIQPGSTVIDIGSGPGRYAEYLLKKDCKIGVVDLSARSVKAFSDRMIQSERKENIIFNEVSCATQLDWIADNSADAILLMGPLYHLINEEHRNIVIKNCKRILRPGGLIYSVFLSLFPVLFSLLKGNETDSDIQEGIINKGISHTKFKGHDVPQFRCWPSEAKRIMTDNGFSYISVKNIDDISLTDEALSFEIEHSSNKIIKETLLTNSKTHGREGCSHQYLYIGQKSLQ